jgi:hypothetical protein
MSRIGFVICYNLESKWPDRSHLEKESTMNEVTEQLTIQEARKRSRYRFEEQFERTFAYELFSPMRKYQLGRFELLKDACWNFRCEETRTQMRGARAGRALSLLGRLKKELGDPTWLSENEAAALDTLLEKLQSLAERRTKGRRRDNLGQTFRRNMGVFLYPAVLTKQGCRALSQQEADEVLAGLSAVALDRTVSLESYRRMRDRERALEKK